MHEDRLADYPWERTLGARPLRDGRAEFRVWAPRAERLMLRLGDGDDYTLDPAGFGIHEGVVSAAPGDDYTYLVDGRELPDPCSRWQPGGLRGPHGCSTRARCRASATASGSRRSIS